MAASYTDPKISEAQFAAKLNLLMGNIYSERDTIYSDRGSAAEHNVGVSQNEFTRS